MDARVQRFRKQARLENRGRSGRRRRYSGVLRALAVEHLREQARRGIGAQTVASELGLSGWSLSRWSRRASVDRSSELRKVEVVPEEAEVSRSVVLTVVTPDGYRIEGLRGPEVRSLLEALR